MTKNDIRRKLCKSDKPMAAKFDKCFAKHGVATSKSGNLKDSAGNSNQQRAKLQTQKAKFTQLLVSISFYYHYTFIA